MTAQVPIFYQALGMPPTSMAYIPAGRDFRQCVDAPKCIGDIVNGDREDIGEFQTTAASLFLALTGWERAHSRQFFSGLGERVESIAC